MLQASLCSLLLFAGNICSAAANNDFEGDRSQDSFATYSDTESIDAAQAADDLLDTLYDFDETPDEQQAAQSNENKSAPTRKRSNSLRQILQKKLFLRAKATPSESIYIITIYDMAMDKRTAEALEKKLRELSQTDSEVLYDLLDVCTEPLASLYPETLATLKRLFCKEIPETYFAIIDERDNTLTELGKQLIRAFVRQICNRDEKPTIIIRPLAELIENRIAIVTKRPHSGSF